jgi:hypothetical protein
MKNGAFKVKADLLRFHNGFCKLRNRLYNRNNIGLLKALLADGLFCLHCMSADLSRYKKTWHRIEKGVGNTCN